MLYNSESLIVYNASVSGLVRSEDRDYTLKVDFIQDNFLLWDAVGSLTAVRFNLTNL